MQAALTRLISGIPTGVDSSAFHFTGLGCSGGSGTPLGLVILVAFNASSNDYDTFPMVNDWLRTSFQSQFMDYGVFLYI